MVPSGVRQAARLLLLLRKIAHGVESAPKLKRAAFLKVLTFKKNFNFAAAAAIELLAQVFV